MVFGNNGSVYLIGQVKIFTFKNPAGFYTDVVNCKPELKVTNLERSGSTCSYRAPLFFN